MYQRLLLLLTVLFISGASMAQNVMNSGDGDYIYNSQAISGSSTNPKPLGTAAGALDTMQKWVHDPSQKNRISWTQTTYKSYRWGAMSFRLRYPLGYDSTKKYPMVIFLHGAGEASPTGNSNNVTVPAPGGGVTGVVNRENQDQLYWGADSFLVRINQGQWNGFVLFPQLYDNSTQWGVENNAFQSVNSIMDTMTKYNGLDPDRVIVMGLSAGGVGSIKFARYFPQRIASVVASSPELISEETTGIDMTVTPNVPYLEYWKEIPLFMTSGGLDNAADSDPPTMFKARDSITAHGTNIFFGFYGNEGHDTWEEQWVVRDIYSNYILTDRWNQAHKAQPNVYFQNTKFCTGQPISAKMGVTPGFFAYEWQMDNGSGFSTIQGATSNTYTATQAGTYQVHFQRTSTSSWSAWTPNPVVITASKCSADTAFAEHFDEAPVVYVAATPTYQSTAYTYQNFTCGNGLFPNHTEDFSVDATGRMGGRFMLNNTLSACSYAATDQVWRTYNSPTVLPNTNYTLTFYVGNAADYYYPYTSPFASLSASINGTVLTPTGGVRARDLGNTSWKQYSYVWNSGNNTSAQIAITNNVATAGYNDFVLDEISLVKYKAVPMPGAAVSNLSMWSKGNSINSPDNSVVSVWTNNDINGFSLTEFTPSLQPVYQNDGSNNINFNPVVQYISSANKVLQIDTGFSGTVVHSAAHAYIVAKFTNTSLSNNVLYEPGTGSTSVKVALANPGILSWTAGTTTISTPSNSIDVTKPSIWSFSKDNSSNTASGNKQEIRKDGIVMNSSNTVNTFTGNNSPFNIGNYGGGAGTFDGNVAEVIYVLDSTLTPLTENRIESYLALKYGNTLGNITTPSNYTASDSTTIFWTKDTKYQNDVFGIGTDSASGLVQTQSNSVNSGSGDGTGQSAKGNLVLSTSTELLDKRFLMIGNDAGALTQHLIVNGESNPIVVGSTRISRNWKVANTNSVGGVSLSFDTTGLGNQSGGAVVSKYALMISNSGDATYSGTLTFFTATGASGKKIFFSGVTLNSGAVFTIITNNVNLALPATWLGFTAEAVNGNGVLNWKTGDEINVASYTVEHSFNGVSFSPIATVAAYNNSGTNNYNYTDAGLAPGNHYYRIRRTDKDGVTDYSDVKTIRITTNGANVQVRPNPVVGSTLVLAVSVQQNSKSNIQVMAVDGKVIVHESVNLASGNNLLNINISTVPPGIYLVQLLLNDEVVTKKFIKER